MFPRLFSSFIENFLRNKQTQTTLPSTQETIPIESGLSASSTLSPSFASSPPLSASSPPLSASSSKVGQKFGIRENFLDRMRRLTENQSISPLTVIITITANNIFCTATYKNRFVLVQNSAGTAGFKNHQKFNIVSAEAIGMKTADELAARNFISFVAHVKAPHHLKMCTYVLKGLTNRLKCDHIIVKTPYAHNGCRPKKMRRL